MTAQARWLGQAQSLLQRCRLVAGAWPGWSYLGVGHCMRYMLCALQEAELLPCFMGQVLFAVRDTVRPMPRQDCCLMCAVSACYDCSAG
jgi:hypothetical protein